MAIFESALTLKFIVSEEGIFVSSLFCCRIDEKRQGSAEYTGTGAKRRVTEKMTFLTHFVPNKI